MLLCWVALFHKEATKGQISFAAIAAIVENYGSTTTGSTVRERVLQYYPTLNYYYIVSYVLYEEFAVLPYVRMVATV